MLEAELIVDARSRSQPIRLKWKPFSHHPDIEAEPTLAKKPVHAPGCITSSGTLKLTRSNAFSMMTAVTVGLKHFASYMSLTMKENVGRLSSLKYKASLFQPIGLNKLNRTFSSHAKSTVESFQDFRDQGWPPGQGWED